MAWSPTPNTKRLRSGAVVAAREATPMLLVLTVPLVIVLGLAMYAVSTVQPAAIPSPDPYPGFRLDRLGSDVRWLYQRLNRNRQRFGGNLPGPDFAMLELAGVAVVVYGLARELHCHRE